MKKITQIMSNNHTVSNLAETILTATGDGIYGVDTAGRLTFMNPMAEKLLGWTLAEINSLGLPGHTLIHHSLLDGSDYPRDQCPIYLAFKEGKIQRRADEVFWRKDGSSFPVEYVSTPIWKNGKLSGAVVLFHDITERKLAEKALHDSETKHRQLRFDLYHVSRLSTVGEMATGFAHELNQPLAAIMNYTQVCKRKLNKQSNQPNEKVLEYLEKIINQVSRANEIIRGIREFMQKGETHRSFVDINTVVEEARKLIFVKEEIDRVNFSAEFAIGLPAVFIDKIQIQQVIFNLVRNALEALAGRVDASLVVKTSCKDEKTIQVSIIDNGPGLQASIKDKLFQSFVTTKAGGMGVGLSICKTIVENHHGKIWVSSIPNQKTTFHFTLPIITKPEVGDE